MVVVAELPGCTLVSVVELTGCTQYILGALWITMNICLYTRGCILAGPAPDL